MRSSDSNRGWIRGEVRLLDHRIYSTGKGNSPLVDLWRLSDCGWSSN